MSLTRLQIGPTTLNVTNVLAYQKRAVLDGINYLYTEHKVVVRALLNPDSARTQRRVNSFLRRLGQENPVYSFDVHPADTEAALRHQLMLPRQQVVLIYGNETWVVGPVPKAANRQTKYSVDAANGPFPEHFDVESLHGDGTFQVIYAITLCINERDYHTNGGSSGNGIDPSPILSHLWEMHTELDRGFFETRVIEGRARFRRDVLLNVLREPDDYRNLLMHPLPYNFHRTLEVGVTDDQCGLVYRITDTERHVNVLGNHVTDFEGYFATGDWTPGATDIGVGIVSGGVGGTEKAEEKGRSRLRGGIQGAAVAVYKALPYTTGKLVLQIWCRAGTTQATMVDSLFRAYDQFKKIFPGQGARAEDLEITMPIHERSMGMSVAYRYDLLGAAISGEGGFLNSIYSPIIGAGVGDLGLKKINDARKKLGSLADKAFERAKTFPVYEIDRISTGKEAPGMAPTNSRGRRLGILFGGPASDTGPTPTLPANTAAGRAPLQVTLGTHY